MLSDLEKEIWNKDSHKAKKLGQHISECKKLVFKLLNFYDLDDYKKFCELLCYCHDLGKLKKEWNVYNEKNPPHSFCSFLYTLLKFKDKLEDFPLLPLFVIKFHSILEMIENKDLRKVEAESITDREKRYIYVVRKNILEEISQLDMNSKINTVDAFGLSKLADILSANNLIDYKIERPNKKIGELEEWLEKVIKKKKLQLKKNILQTQINLNKIENHLLIRAPTGWGKTAASLSYAIGKKKRIIYILPTITSIKSFYDEICNFFDEKNVSELFYYSDVEVTKKEDADFQELVLSSYFTKPVTITTLDQLLLTFLQVGKYFLKRPHLRNSVIILDEVHTFSQNMLHILSFFIKKFVELYNLKLCVMSATFPTELQKHFNKLLDGKVKKLCLNDEFKNRRRIMYKLFDKDILEIVKDTPPLLISREKPLKVAIICNTVEKSQKVFENLEGLMDKQGIVIKLLHSRFIYKHRNKKEKEINDLIKKRKSFILVATQVIEVSLDISFDLMITECAPVGSLVQRFGRVNRYKEKINKTNVWIVFPKEIDSSKKYPYDKDEIHNTWKFLKKLEGEKLKNELQLINEYDNTFYLEKLKNEDIYRSLEKWEEHTNFFYSWNIKDESAQKLFRFRDDFTMLVIPTIYEKEIEKLCREMKKQNPSYVEKRKTFAKIKEYTVPVPIWMVKRISPKENSPFPMVPLFYDEKYGIKKEEDSII